MRVISAMLFLTLCLAVAHAADLPERVWVVSVKVGAYQTAGMTATPLNPDAQTEPAAALRALLPRATVALQLSTEKVAGQSAPTRANILEALAMVQRKALAADRLILYLSGQVATPPGGDKPTAFLPTDADINTPATWLDFAELDKQLQAIPCVERVVIYDLAPYGENAALSPFLPALLDGLGAKGENAEGVITATSLQAAFGAQFAAAASPWRHLSATPPEMLLRPLPRVQVMDFAGDGGENLAKQIQTYLANTGCMQLDGAPADYRIEGKVEPTGISLTLTDVATGTQLPLPQAPLAGAEQLAAAAAQAADAAFSAMVKNGWCPRRAGTLTIDDRTFAVGDKTLVTVTYPNGEKVEKTSEAATTTIAGLRPGAVTIQLTRPDLDASCAGTVSPTPAPAMAIDAGKLALTVSPADATVEIRRKGETAFHPGEKDESYELGEWEFMRNPGAWEVRVSRDGYITQTPSPVIVKTGKITKFSVKLEKMKTGSLKLDSTPEGAAITIDGQLAQEVTPAEILNLTPGQHTVKLTLPNYKDLTASVTIAAEESTPFNKPLICILPVLKISISEKLDAEIFLDGKSNGTVTAGETQSAYVEAGTHTITAICRNYLATPEKATVAVGDPERAVIVTVKPRVGTLRLDMYPNLPETRVTINNIVYAPDKVKAPITLPIGKYRVTVAADGYESAEIPALEVNEDKETAASVTLTLLCTLDIYSLIPDATVELSAGGEASRILSDGKDGVTATTQILWMNETGLADGGGGRWVRHYRVPNLKPGPVTVTISRKDFSPTTVNKELVSADRNEIIGKPTVMPNTGILRVFTDPPGLEFSVKQDRGTVGWNGMSTEQGALSTNLNPGKYLIMKPGERRGKAFDVKSDVVNEVVLEDKASRVKYSVHVLQVLGKAVLDGTAQVFIDGRYFGTAAKKGRLDVRLTAGRHSLAVVAENYQPFAGDIVVSDGGGTEVTLQPMPATLVVKPTPEDAAFELIDAETREVVPDDPADGIGRYTALIPKHPYSLKVTHVGYLDRMYDVDISTTKTTNKYLPNSVNLEEIALNPAATIHIAFTPADVVAALFIDGVNRGQSDAVKNLYLPEIIDPVNETRVELIVLATGYQLQQKVFGLKRGSEVTTEGMDLKTDPAKPGVGMLNPNQNDPANMVWVPAGRCMMGSDMEANAHPHEVFLQGFWIYQDEVTVRQFRNFWKAKYGLKKKLPLPPNWSEEYPMVNVSWELANEYAAWVGGALPTEAQWEYAARGSDGRLYPWGNDWQASDCLNTQNGPKGPVKVGNFKADQSPFNVRDMAGNVAEWCRDIFMPEYDLSVRFNPDCQVKGKLRVVRGGAWRVLGDCKAARRAGVAQGADEDYIGFRVVVPGYE